MDELQRLIMEQAKDMAAGSFQEPEPNTIPLGEWERHLSNEGFTPEISDRIDDGWECVLHGREDIVKAPDSWIGTNGRYWRCRLCTREQQKRWAATNKEKVRITNTNYQRKRYATDPEWRARKLEQNRRWRAKNGR